MLYSLTLAFPKHVAVFNTCACNIAHLGAIGSDKGVLHPGALAILYPHHMTGSQHEAGLISTQCLQVPCCVMCISEQFRCRNQDMCCQI